MNEVDERALERRRELTLRARSEVARRRALRGDEAAARGVRERTEALLPYPEREWSEPEYDLSNLGPDLLP